MGLPRFSLRLGTEGNAMPVIPTRGMRLSIASITSCSVFISSPEAFLTPAAERAEMRCDPVDFVLCRRQRLVFNGNRCILSTY